MATAVQDHRQTAERLAPLVEELRRLGVRRISLFGSVLRGCPRPDSDIDLIVEFAPGAKTYASFVALIDLLEECLGREVELVTPEALSPFIARHILAEAEDVVRAA